MFCASGFASFYLYNRLFRNLRIIVPVWGLTMLATHAAVKGY